VDFEVEVSRTFKEIAQKISSAQFGTSHLAHDLIFRQQDCEIQINDRRCSFSASNWPIEVQLHLAVRHNGGSP
jgi:hypothetical protein